jgi:hypothetical protein
MPKCDRVTTSYTCTAAKSTSSDHKVRDVTLGRARGLRGRERRVEFESPRLRDVETLRYQEDQAADTERLQPTISTRRRVTVIGNRILLVLVLAPHPSHT